MNKNIRKQNYYLVIIGSVLLFSIGVSICFGTATISWDTIKSIFSASDMTTERTILLYVRIPRVVGGAFSGAALAAAGMILQNILNNPLASPGIIGVNSGAGFFVALSITLFPSVIVMVPIMAFLGAFIAMLLIYFTARKVRASRTTVILAGIAVNSILNGGIDIIHVINPTAVLGTLEFRVGGFHAINTHILLPACIMIGVALLLLGSLCIEIEILMLGDEMANSLGLHTERIRFMTLALAAVLAGAAVSFSGLLGFVGLIVPHIARFIVGSQTRYLLPASIMLGASCVLLSDLLARMMVRPYELPAGIILSMLGAPFFLYLLFYKKRGIHND